MGVPSLDFHLAWLLVFLAPLLSSLFSLFLVSIFFYFSFYNTTSFASRSIKACLPAKMDILATLTLFDSGRGVGGEADLPPPSHIRVYACVYVYKRANFLTFSSF